MLNETNKMFIRCCILLEFVSLIFIIYFLYITEQNSDNDKDDESDEQGQTSVKYKEKTG